MGIRMDEDENEPNSLKKYVPDFADFEFNCPE